MRLPFTKMQGCGNDFVLIDALREPVTLTGEQLRRLADRHFGVGCDQVLFAEPPPDADSDVGYRIVNADGSEVEQCGNGLRCLAAYLRSRGLAPGPTLRIASPAGVVTAELLTDTRVRVAMGVPRLSPRALPLAGADQALRYTCPVAGGEVTFGAVSMGNPHAVIAVEEVDQAPVESLGAALGAAECFPRGVNVGFMQVLGRDGIRLRVYERGAGETLACGTGACAAVVVGRLWERLDEIVTVHLPGGELTIEWRGEGEPVYLTGPAELVYTGEIIL